MPINFPSSPTPNQTYAFGQKTWIWNGYAWDLQLANANSVIAISQASYNQANAAFIHANAAFTQANTASGADQYARNTANASFIHANSAFNAANNALDTWVRGQANAAFIQANAAFIQANTPSHVANSAAIYANGAFAAANASAAIDVTQNNSITVALDTANAAFIHANAAYNQANTGGGGADQYARNTANAAFTVANAAITFTSSSTPPSSPSAGDQWYNTNNDILYEYINDGTSDYWVDITSSAITTSNVSITTSGSADILNPFLLAGM